MIKSKYYYKTRFSADIFEEAHDLFLSKLDQTQDIKTPQTLRVTKRNESWDLDSREEFLTECRSADSFYFDHMAQNKRLLFNFYDFGTTNIHVASSSRP
jgi:hypothetical protein